MTALRHLPQPPGRLDRRSNRLRGPRGAAFPVLAWASRGGQNHRPVGRHDPAPRRLARSGHPELAQRYAVPSNAAEMYGATGGWPPARSPLGTVRIRAISTGAASPVFAGIARVGAASRHRPGRLGPTVTGSATFPRPDQRLTT